MDAAERAWVPGRAEVKAWGGVGGYSAKPGSPSCEPSASPSAKVGAH